jgi:thioredoxin 1
MAMLCICGICIPYSVLWPRVRVFFKKICSFVSPPAKDVNGGKEAKLEGKPALATPVETDKVAPFPRNYKSDQDWEETIGRDVLTVFRFTAKWCKPCKALDPLYHELSKDHMGQAVFYNVDVDECDEVAALNGAVAIPLFVSYRAGKKLESLRSSDSDKIAAFVRHSIAAAN